MIQVKNLTKEYMNRSPQSRTLALDSLSLTFNSPGIYGILGLNGAGKTSLIKILMGLISVDRGVVEVLGYDPYKRHQSFLKQMGFVSAQKATLDPHIPLQTTLTLVGTMYGVAYDVLVNRIHTISKRLSIQHKLSVPLRNMSLGERMKAEVIGSILHQPRVLFLDEPTIGLDFESQISIRALIAEEQQQNHSLVLLTSHSIQDIRQLCEMVVILDKGKKVYEGFLEEIVKQKGKNIFIDLLIQEMKL